MTPKQAAEKLAEMFPGATSTYAHFEYWHEADGKHVQKVWLSVGGSDGPATFAPDFATGLAVIRAKAGLDSTPDEQPDDGAGKGET